MAAAPIRSNVALDMEMQSVAIGKAMQSQAVLVTSPDLFATVRHV